MKNYESPVVLEYEDLAEGIYAASGASEIISEDEPECWTINVTKDQPDAGGYSTFRVEARHSTAAQHISQKTVMTIVFTKTITSVEFEGFDVQVSGVTAILTREAHGNSYGSGDNFNSLMKVWAPDLDGLEAASYTITCAHKVNVQGIYD